MKKMLTWTIVKSLAVVAIVGVAIYYAYRYFTGSTGSGAITGNSGISNFLDNKPSTNGDDLKKAPPLESLFMRAKNAEDSAVEFNQDVTLTDADGKSFTVKKGNVIKGKLDILMVTGGTITAQNSKYYITPLSIYNLKKVEIDGTKVAEVIRLEYYNKLESLKSV